MKTTKQRLIELRAIADQEYESIQGGEVYFTIHAPDYYNLLDDADRCEELETGIYAELGRCMVPTKCEPCKWLRALLTGKTNNDQGNI